MSSDIGLSFFRAAHQNVEHMIGTAIRDLLNLQMHKLGDVFQLAVLHGCEGRHAFFRETFFQERQQMLTVVVAEHNVGCDQAGPRCAARLRPVTESAILLEKRRAALGGRFVRLRTQAQKSARGGGPLFRRHVLIGHRMLRAILIAGLYFLAECHSGKNQKGRGRSYVENRTAHAPIPFLIVLPTSITRQALRSP